MTLQCLISLGSNLGERQSILTEAARSIAAADLVQSFEMSRLFETPPIGGPEGQEPFLNAVAAIETAATAREVLRLLQVTEQTLGRQRNRRWDARSIDLDVVLHGDLVGGASSLVVPHPRYPARRFVLEPACDVAAHFRDPRFGWTIRRLTDHVANDQPSLALVGGEREQRQLLCKRLRDERGIVTFLTQPPEKTIGALANTPGNIETVDGGSTSFPPLPDRAPNTPWVLDDLPAHDGSIEMEWTGHLKPRLIARIHHVTAETAWPAPHQMWPKSWSYPEYRLELDDPDWAVGEIASAIDSMRCRCAPVTDDGSWWR